MRSDARKRWGTDAPQREWKPGDVATATVNGRPNVRVIAGWSKYEPQLRWGELSPRWADGDDDECWFMPSQVSDARPLAVIDPENDEQVERLTDAFTMNEDPRYNCASLHRVGAMRNALRKIANPTPPKPEVYSHIVATSAALTRSLCGKVWKPTMDVQVVGKCPECKSLAQEWTA